MTAHAAWILTLAIEAAYRHDELQGRYAEFDDEGVLFIEALYAKGAKNGYCRTFDEGVRTLNATYRSDVLHGKAKIAVKRKVVSVRLH